MDIDKTCSKNKAYNPRYNNAKVKSFMRVGDEEILLKIINRERLNRSKLSCIS